MGKLLDKPIEVLKATVDSKPDSLIEEFIGNVFVEFFDVVSSDRRSNRKCRIYIDKVAELLNYTAKRADVSQFGRLQISLLSEFNLERNSKKPNSRRISSKKSEYELYHKPYTPCPKESELESEVREYWI